METKTPTMEPKKRHKHYIKHTQRLFLKNISLGQNGKKHTTFILQEFT